MRKGLFIKNRIKSERLRSQKGASIVFALVGFMFAAMIAFVVVNAAYSAATRTKKMKVDEQSFLLAQSMSGIIAEALTGDGSVAKLPNNTDISSPDGTLKYDALTVGYQFIEQKNTAADGAVSINMFYNNTENGTTFTKSDETGDAKKTFCIVKSKASLSDAGTSVKNMINAMAQKIDRGSESATETLTTTFTNATPGEFYKVETVFTMDKSYSINAVTTAWVKRGSDSGEILSRYIVRTDASAAVRTDKLVCVGKRSADGNSIQAAFTDYAADAEGEELVKISCYSVTWPVDQMRSVYIAP